MTRSLLYPVVATFCMALAQHAVGALPPVQRTFTLGLDPVILDVVVTKGDVTISYNHEGQLTVYASAKDSAGRDVSQDFFSVGFTAEQNGNMVKIRSSRDTSYLYPGIKITYIIDVPRRTQVTSSVVEAGNQVVLGITGPAKIKTAAGDIEASYVDSVQAESAKGNILCTKDQQVNAVAGTGNITLLEDGLSVASVMKGLGSIEVGGAQARFEGTTDKGDLHIKAVLHDDWQLRSLSGGIRIELPSKAQFDADLATNSGQISVQRKDMEKSDTEIRTCNQKVEGGGKRIMARTETGNIFIQ